jgi:hypothetical protein
MLIIMVEAYFEAVETSSIYFTLLSENSIFRMLYLPKLHPPK